MYSYLQNRSNMDCKSHWGGLLVPERQLSENMRNPAPIILFTMLVEVPSVTAFE